MSKQMEENNMKNFSNYTDFDTKENLHFESKAVLVVCFKIITFAVGMQPPHND